METPLLAAALIVKNEEHALPGCLEALNELRPLLSEICVYDTGSTDRTVEIAEAAGARVERGYWDEDFARAKNAAGAMASAKWVLSVDADERLVVPSASRLRRALREALTSDLTGVDCMRVAIADVRGGREIQAHDAIRLYRPNRCRWVGRVHERIAPSSSNASLRMAEPGRAVIRLDHFGYGDEAKNPERYSRNLRLADASVKDFETSSERDDQGYVQALVDRGRTRRATGDTEGALQDLEAAWEVPADTTYRAFGGELLAETAIQVGRHEQAAAVIAQLRAEGVSHPSYCDWLEASLATAQGDSRRALELLRTVDILASSLGLVVKPKVILEDRMWAAIAEGEHLEAASLLVNLMSAQGVVRRKFGDLLVRLTTAVPIEGLVELLMDHDRGNGEAVAAELDLSPHPGPEIADALRRKMRSQGHWHAGHMSSFYGAQPI